MTENERKGIEKSKMGLIVTIALVVILAISNVWSYTSLQNQIDTLSNEKSNLQSQVNTLQTDNTNFENELDSLNTTYQDYVSNYTRSDSVYDSLNTAYQNYMATHSHSNSAYDILANEKNQLQTWLYGNISLLQTTTAERNQLQTWLDGNITNYESQISSLNIQITNLQNQIDSLKAPQLHLVNYESTVTPVWLGTDYVTVKGTIFNSGSNLATNVVFTVRIYDSGGTLLKTEQIAFGTISGKSYKNFDTDIGAEGANYITTTLTYD